MGSKSLSNRQKSTLGFFDKDYSSLKYYRPGQAEQLQALVTTQSPDTFWRDSSWNVSDPSFRQLALMYHAQTHKEGGMASSGDYQERALRLSTTRVVYGNLSIDKHLIIEGSGSLVVLGNLDVGGNIVVASDYPGLYVAGTLRAENLFASQSEILVLQEIHIRNIAALKYNHTVVIAPKIRAAVRVLDDAFPDTRFESHDPETELESFERLGVAFLQAKIDPGFKDTHQTENEYYEMLDDIDDKIRAFFRA